MEDDGAQVRLKVYHESFSFLLGSVDHRDWDVKKAVVTKKTVKTLSYCVEVQHGYMSRKGE